MIPRILNQIWIGPLPPPQACMDTWREKHPDWTYILWTSEKAPIGQGYDPEKGKFVVEAGTEWHNQKSIDAIEGWEGKADLMRMEILLAMGGIYVDADSICVRKLDDHFLQHPCWATYENEKCRPGVITNAFMGAEPGQDLFADMVTKVPYRDLKEPAWKAVGPTFLTEVAAKHPELAIYGSKAFTPLHFSGTPGQGDIATYARHEFHNTLGTYEQPKGVSCIIACKGQSQWLPQCVDSVLAQTVTVDEIVIACGDDRSYDQAISLQHYRVPRIQVFRDEGEGPAKARNEAIRRSKSFTLFCLDADDWVEPNWLEKTLPHARGSRFIVATSMMNFGDRTGVWHFPPPTQILREDPFTACSLFSRELWQLAGGYPEDLPGYEDWAFWISCCRHRPFVSVVREPLLNYRVHAGQEMERIRREGLDGQYRQAIRDKFADLYERFVDVKGSRPVKDETVTGMLPPLMKIGVGADDLDDPPRRTRPIPPEEAAVRWRPDILGLSSTDILIFLRRIAPELPDNAQCVELGVFHGRSLLFLAELLHDLGKTRAVIMGVDPFEYYEGSKEATMRNASKVCQWKGPMVDLFPTTSLEAAELVPDGSQDLVFIDASHERADVAADIKAWLPKLKPGAIMAGHDYNHNDLPGVKLAVDEAFGDKVQRAVDTVWMVRV